MPILKIYAKPGTDAITSYDYVDISEGTGIINFKGFSTYMSGAKLFHLGTQTISSSDIESGASVTTGWTFNLTAFNKPQIIRGTAIIRFSSYVAAGAGDLYWVLTLTKVNLDASTTTLGSVITTQQNSAAITVMNFTNKIDITQTKFKRGESLRLDIVSHPPAGRVHYFGHDPSNRDGTFVTPAGTYPTKLEVLIPFKIDVN